MKPASESTLINDSATDLGAAGFGLMFYNARWPRSVPVAQRRGYDPMTGRFAQADSIVPGGIQGLDRYAYANNSPFKYIDPSGHFTVDEMCKYWGYCGKDAETRAREELGALFNVMWNTSITWGDIAYLMMDKVA